MTETRAASSSPPCRSSPRSTVRAARGRSRALRVSIANRLSVALFVWARRALDRQKRRSPAPLVPQAHAPAAAAADGWPTAGTPSGPRHRSHPATTARPVVSWCSRADTTRHAVAKYVSTRRAPGPAPQAPQPGLPAQCGRVAGQPPPHSGNHRHPHRPPARSPQTGRAAGVMAATAAAAAAVLQAVADLRAATAAVLRPAACLPVAALAVTAAALAPHCAACGTRAPPSRPAAHAPPRRAQWRLPQPSGWLPWQRQRPAAAPAQGSSSPAAAPLAWHPALLPADLLAAPLAVASLVALLGAPPLAAPPRVAPVVAAVLVVGAAAAVAAAQPAAACPAADAPRPAR